jgi:hypothetical protein
MESFQNQYIKTLAKIGTPSYINTYNGGSNLVSPAYSELLYNASIKFDVFKYQANSAMFNNMVTEPGVVTKEFFENISKDITDYSAALLITSTQILNQYISNTLKYTKICQRFLYGSSIINNEINSLLNYSYTHIDNTKDIYFDNTTTYTIGDFITLPFCINNVKNYNKSFYVTSSSIEDIQYTNVGDISILPLSTPILTKYMSNSGNNLSDINLQCYIESTEINVVYIKTYGNIQSIKIDLINGSNIVYSGINQGSEALFIFNPTIITGMNLTISAVNYNISKQASFEISEIVLLSNVKFSRQADFETKQIELNNYIELNTIDINAVDYVNSNEAYFDKYASISFNNSEDSKSFFKIDSITGASINASKVTQTSQYLLSTNNTTESNQVVINSRVASTFKDVSAIFYKMLIDETINYKQGRLFLGTNDAFGAGRNGSSATDNIYENWTKIDNYYRTMLINNESNIFIDIGTNEIKINNRVVSGVIQIPIGISVIDVHQSLFDPSLGNAISLTNSTAINSALNTDQYIYGDNLFPNNFIYKIAGLPSYSNGTIQTGQQILSQYISGTTIINCGSPILPLTVNIIGLAGLQYNLHLGTTPITPGTFTVEPNKGIIRVHSYVSNASKEEDTINITFTRASSSIKPCGILFNRMAVNLDYKSIYNMLARLGTYDNTFYTYVEQEGNKYVLIPDVANTSGLPFLKTYHNKFSYNTFENNVFVSAKLTLITNNSNISPAIKDVYIQGLI